MSSGCAVVAGAQEPVPAPVPAPLPVPAPIVSKPVAGGLARAQCRGQVIEEIVLLAKPALFQAKLPDFVPNAAAIADFVTGAQSRFHSATRPEAVLPFLLLHEGDVCDERRRSESERVLRSQNYIAEATITPYQTATGQVLLVVETTDELTVILSAQPTPRAPFLRRLRFGNPNVYGFGIRAVAGWQSGQGFRDGYSAELAKYAVMSQPVILSLQGERAPLGGRWQAELTKPFFTDFQRFAWQLQAGDRRSYVGLLRPDSEPVSLDVRRRYSSVGAVTRIGPPGRFALVGLSINAQRDEAGRDPVVVGRGVLIPTAETRLPLPYATYNSVRVTGLLGLRQIRFFRAAGFDAVEGLQDLKTGLEVGSALGRGVRTLGSDDADWFLNGGFFAGAGNAESYGYVTGGFEGRWVPQNAQWDGVLTSAQGQGFLRISPTQTLVSQIDWSSGDRLRTPFQLTARDINGGVRGFGSSRAAGARRLVVRLEDRIYLGRIRSLSALALAPFADLGRLWGGNVPFGATSPYLGSIGIGLLGAVPPQSQLTWRADLALRVTPDPYASRWQLRFTIRDAGRQQFREPGDIARNRSSTVPTSLFTWP